MPQQDVCTRAGPGVIHVPADAQGQAGSGHLSCPAFATAPNFLVYVYSCNDHSLPSR